MAASPLEDISALGPQPGFFSNGLSSREAISDFRGADCRSSRAG